MLEPVTCFACEREPEQQCARCGRPYCSDHGEELCDACLQPASGVPSFTLYRGSLLALLIGTALAVWLLIQPGGGDGETAFRPVAVPTSSDTGVATQVPSESPLAGTASPGPVATQEPTPVPVETAVPGGMQVYVVEPGDVLSLVCQELAPPSMSVADCIDEVVLRNGLSSPDDISVGEELLIPQ